MVDGLFCVVMSIVWVLLIIAQLYLIIKSFIKVRNLGDIISKCERKFNFFIINGLIFCVLVIQNITSYIHFSEFYYIIAAIGLLMGAFLSFYRGIRKIAIYENGVTTDMAVIEWSRVSRYNWFTMEDAKHMKLMLFINYKLLIWNFQNKEIKFDISLDAIQRVQNVLDLKGIDKL